MLKRTLSITPTGTWRASDAEMIFFFDFVIKSCGLTFCSEILKCVEQLYDEIMCTPTRTSKSTGRVFPCDDLPYACLSVRDAIPLVFFSNALTRYLAHAMTLRSSMSRCFQAAFSL